ncbi:MAG: carboxypeptidase-like regulatory domain-containing protein, partial [Chitinophagaceae bacterium]
MSGFANKTKRTSTFEKKSNFHFFIQRDTSLLTGTVSTDSGVALEGVTVSFKGTSIATQTNAKGRFSLRVPTKSGI